MYLRLRQMDGITRVYARAGDNYIQISNSNNII